MKDRLPISTLKSALALVGDSISPGEQVNYNHTDCPAGEDTRARLYIKLSDDGKLLLCHCFNCGRSGFIKVKPSLLPKTFKTWSESDSYHKDVERYGIFLRVYASGTDEISIADYSQVPIKYFSDTPQLSTSFEDAAHFGIRRVKYTASFIFPRPPMEDGRPSGFERYNQSCSPKWSRCIHPSVASEPKELLYTPKKKSGIVVVCEDPLSAMKISLLGYNGLAKLNSSPVGSDLALKLANLYEEQYIWYDNDSREVKSNAITSRDTINFYGGNCKGIWDLRDPKKCHPEVIEGALSPF